ncbi:hypothetical protein [Bacillus cereus]|uniref:hypothetical protein n=1 Tax=Bacillus cereus TaxID=1396 RepID=UPI0039813936
MKELYVVYFVDTIEGYATIEAAYNTEQEAIDKVDELTESIEDANLSHFDYQSVEVQ